MVRIEEILTIKRKRNGSVFLYSWSTNNPIDIAYPGTDVNTAIIVKPRTGLLYVLVVLNTVEHLTVWLPFYWHTVIIEPTCDTAWS